MPVTSFLYVILLITMSVQLNSYHGSASELLMKTEQPLKYSYKQLNDSIEIPHEERILTWLKENKVPGIGIGIIEEGELKQVKIIGKLDKNSLAPENTVFNVASLTKPVVAILTLKLAQEGIWDLDEPLAKYWIDPDIKNDTLHNLLTSRLILSHQTGFPNWRGEHKLLFEFKPGTRYQYSGEGFEYLRKAIEQKLGRSLEDLSQTYLFTPLNMQDTRYVWDFSLEERFALWHDKQGKLYQTWKRTEANAADDLLTTVEDYGKFAVHVLKGAGLSKDLFSQMIRPQVQVKAHVDYGLGWLVVKDLPHKEYALVHSGADQGVRCIIILFPNSKRGIILMTNGDNGHKVMEKLVNESLDIGRQLVSYL